MPTKEKGLTDSLTETLKKLLYPCNRKGSQKNKLKTNNNFTINIFINTKHSLLR